MMPTATQTRTVTGVSPTSIESSTYQHPGSQSSNSHAAIHPSSMPRSYERTPPETPPKSTAKEMDAAYALLSLPFARPRRVERTPAEYQAEVRVAFYSERSARQRNMPLAPYRRTRTSSHDSDATTSQPDIPGSENPAPCTWPHQDEKNPETGAVLEHGQDPDIKIMEESAHAMLSRLERDELPGVDRQQERAVDDQANSSNNEAIGRRPLNLPQTADAIGGPLDGHSQPVPDTRELRRARRELATDLGPSWQVMGNRRRRPTARFRGE